MNFDELLGTLLESGSEKLFYHYTNMIGFLNILKSGYIKSGSTYSNLNQNLDQISVIRPSGSKDIESITGPNSKNLVARFEIQFDIVNDKIHNIKAKPINEPVLNFEKEIEEILNKYKLLDNKKDIINNVKKYKENFSNFDYKKLHNKIYNYLYNLINKEGEERIYIDKIKLDNKYIKIFLLDNCFSIYKNSNLKDQLMFESKFYDYIDYFVDNDVFKKFQQIFGI